MFIAVLLQVQYQELFKFYEGDVMDFNNVGYCSVYKQKTSSNQPFDNAFSRNF